MKEWLNLSIRTFAVFMTRYTHSYMITSIMTLSHSICIIILNENAGQDQVAIFQGCSSVAIARHDLSILEKQLSCFGTKLFL